MGGRGSVSASSAFYSGGIPKTGQALYVAYSHNTQKSEAPRGMDFGQQLEPAGYYANVSASSAYMAENPLTGWEAGYLAIENPLVLEHVSTGSNGWKKTLSDMYGGKTGKALSNAVKRDGYDAIVTVESDYPSDPFNETVILTKKPISAEEFNRRKAR